MSVDKYPKLFTPRYPLLIVEELPTANTFGSIIIPGDDNKVMHEGVVIRTWEPFDRQIGYVKLEHEAALEDIAKDPTCAEHKEAVAKQVIRTAACTDDEHEPCMVCKAIHAARAMLKQREKYHRMESQFQPGDHVCYPHYSGTEDKVYRGLKWILEYNEFDQGGKILGLVEHERLDVVQEMSKVLGAGYLGPRENVIPTLLEHFVIVPKRSVTRGPTR